MRIPNLVKKGWARVKSWWDRLPKLPRKWRIVRNLAAAAVLAVLALELLEWPSLSARSVFRRLEGAYLLTPSQIVLEVEHGSTAGYLAEGEDWITVGSVEKYDSGSKPLNLDKREGILHQVLPKEGIVAVLLPAKNEANGAVVAVWGAPPEAVSGTLELDLKDIDDPFGYRPVSGPETFSAQARRREDGWFVFQFEPHYHGENTFCIMEMLMWSGPVFSSEQMEQPYRLTLTDARGEAVAEQSGTLPPDQRLRQWQ